MEESRVGLSAGNELKQARICALVVDQEEARRELISRFLEAWNFEVLSASGSEEALELASQLRASIAVVAASTAATSGGGRNGIELLRALRAACPSLETILLAEDESAPYAEEAFRAGAYDCLKLPVDFKQLSRDLNTLRESVQRNIEKQIWEKASGTDAGLGQMVGISAPMQAVFGLIRRLAPEQAPVLITGLIGTGKELVARAIHDLSPLAGEPMTIYRCCGVSEELAAAELFGSSGGISDERSESKGQGPAPSGPGILQACEGGTLLLDEIAELSPSIQARLAGEMRTGGTTRKSAPAMILATTRLNLANQAGRGQFNGDLFRLLSQNVIHLPSLVERREDIPLLCRHFQEKFNQEFGKKTCGFSPAAEHTLLSNRWPGNVRQLENVIGRACLLADENWIEFADLFVGNLSSGDASSAKASGEHPAARAADVGTPSRNAGSKKAIRRLPRSTRIAPKSGV